MGVNRRSHYRPDSLRTQPLETHDSNQPSAAKYHAGLLRLWRDGQGGAWHASLQDTKSGERIGFADLERLFAYLLRLTSEAPDASAMSTTPERWSPKQSERS